MLHSLGIAWCVLNCSLVFVECCWWVWFVLFWWFLWFCLLFGFDFDFARFVGFNFYWFWIGLLCLDSFVVFGYIMYLGFRVFDLCWCVMFWVCFVVILPLSGCFNFVVVWVCFGFWSVFVLWLIVSFMNVLLTLFYTLVCIVYLCFRLFNVSVW